MAEKRKRRSEVNNIAQKLSSREIGNRFALRNAQSQIKFHNFQLQEEFDTFSPIMLPEDFRDGFMKIEEIVSAQGIIFALAQSGVCAAIDRNTNKMLCYLNLDPHDKIRRLYYNRENDSLITVSISGSNGISIKCRTTQIEYIRRAQPDAGIDLFESENVTLPGFVLFDDINGKALTFSAQDHIYKLFDLKNYTLLCSISDKQIEAIRVTCGIMLLIRKKSPCGRYLPLKILSMADGKVLKSFRHALVPNKKVDFVELFHEKILLRQENERLQMVDVQSEKIIDLSRQELENPSALIFLHAKRLFLTFYSGNVFVWNLQAELVASYRNHLIRLTGLNTSIVFLTNDEDLVLAYNKVHKPLETHDKTNCSISIVNILTGICYAKIGGNDPDAGISCRNRPNASLIQSTVEDALEDVSTLFYEAERNEIYTGTTGGLVHIWSN